MLLSRLWQRPGRWAATLLNYGNMKPTFLAVLCFCFFQSCVPTYINRNKVTTTYISSQGPDITHIKKFYFGASGNMSSKVVSDNLFSALSKIMQKNGSMSVFEFNSTYTPGEKYTIEKIEAGLYDGFMLLSPKDTASIDTKTKYVFATPLSSTSAVYGSGRGRAYEDSFTVELYNSQKELIYKGEISFHFDPTQDSYYRAVAEKLIRQLRQAYIQLW
jgi:hypothetical protein